MKSIIRSIAFSAVLFLLKVFRGTMIRSFKIEAIKAYLRIISVARQISILWIAVAATLLISLLGVFMIHVGIFGALYFAGLRWSLVALVAVLGLLYLGAGIAIIYYICREKTWLEHSNASQMVASVAGKGENVF
ncbi:MAG: hypothetical protein QXH80_01025 [Candidatus Nanoarchaeia archaeon]